MSRTVTAYYDNRPAADAARERLRAAGFHSGHILDQSSDGYDAGAYSTRDKPGIWASLKNAFLPDEDRHHYEEGIRRGGAVVSLDVDHDDVPRVVEILENEAADIGAHAGRWREEGWRSPAAAGSAAAANRVDMGGGRADAGEGHRSPDYDMDGTPDYGHEPGDNTMDTPSAPHATREHDSGRVRSYFGGGYATEPAYAHGGRTGTKAAGLADEAVGNAKQAAGALTGSDGLRQDGVAQERRGEALQGSRD